MEWTFRQFLQRLPGWRPTRDADVVGFRTLHESMDKRCATGLSARRGAQGVLLPQLQTTREGGRLQYRPLQCGEELEPFLDFLCPRPGCLRLGLSTRQWMCQVLESRRSHGRLLHPPDDAAIDRYQLQHDRV